MTPPCERLDSLEPLRAPLLQEPGSETNDLRKASTGCSTAFAMRIPTTTLPQSSPTTNSLYVGPRLNNRVKAIVPKTRTAVCHR